MIVYFQNDLNPQIPITYSSSSPSIPKKRISYDATLNIKNYHFLHLR